MRRCLQNPLEKPIEGVSGKKLIGARDSLTNVFDEAKKHFGSLLHRLPYDLLSLFMRERHTTLSRLVRNAAQCSNMHWLRCLNEGCCCNHFRHCRHANQRDSLLTKNYDLCRFFVFRSLHRHVSAFVERLPFELVDRSLQLVCQLRIVRTRHRSVTGESNFLDLLIVSKKHRGNS